MGLTLYWTQGNKERRKVPDSPVSCAKEGLQIVVIFSSLYSVQAEIPLPLHYSRLDSVCGAGGVSVIAKHVKWKVYSIIIFYLADLIIQSHFQKVVIFPLL